MTADALIDFFDLMRVPRVPVHNYYDVVAQMLTNTTGNWLAFGVGWNRTFRELNRVRNRYTHDNKLYGFDWWGGLPEDWRPGFPKGTFKVDREKVVSQYRYDPNVIFIEGLFEETLNEETFERIGDISLIHVDCDLYSSTRLALDRCPIGPGTMLMFDEFYIPSNAWDWTRHEALAFYEYCTENAVEARAICRPDMEWGTFSEQMTFLML